MKRDQVNFFGPYRSGIPSFTKIGSIKLTWYLARSLLFHNGWGTSWIESLRLWVLSLKFRVFGSSSSFPPICFSICRTSCKRKHALYLQWDSGMWPPLLIVRPVSRTVCRHVSLKKKQQPSSVYLEPDNYHLSLPILKFNNCVQYPPPQSNFSLSFLHIGASRY